jgi:hypothetical protein
MLLSRLYDLLRNAPLNVHEFVLYLAVPDSMPGDDTDVQLTVVGDVVLDYEKKEVRLIPASTIEGTSSASLLSCLGPLMQILPSSVDADTDMQVFVSLPLLREESSVGSPELAELKDVRIDAVAQEVWFLVRSAREFPDGSLPTWRSWDQT